MGAVKELNDPILDSACRLDAEAGPRAASIGKAWLDAEIQPTGWASLGR